MANASGKNCRLHIYLLAMLAIMTTASLAGLLYFSQVGLGSSRALLASGENPDPAHISVDGSTVTVMPVGSADRDVEHPWADRINDPDVGVPGASATTSRDVRNVQWAVDNVAEGGTVLLSAGTYEFGTGWIQEPDPQVVDFFPYYLLDKGIPAHADFVGIDRDVTVKGQGMPKIVGGFGAFRTYDEVNATIDGIHFDKALGQAIAVAAADDVVIKNNKITNVVPVSMLEFPKMSYGIQVSGTLWHPVGDYPLTESIQTWIAWLGGNPDMLIAQWPGDLAGLPGVAHTMRSMVPQLPGLEVPPGSSQMFANLRNFFMTPLIAMGMETPISDYNIYKKSATKQIRKVTVENNDIDLMGSDSTQDPLVVPGDYSTYEEMWYHMAGVYGWNFNTDTQIAVKNNTIKNYGLWGVGLLASSNPNSKFVVEDNTITERRVSPTPMSEPGMGVVLADQFYGGPPATDVTNNQITMDGGLVGVAAKNGSNIKVSGNTISGNGNAAVNMDSQVSASGNKILNNDFTGFTANFVQIGLTGLINSSTIHGNQIGQLSPAAFAGISLQGDNNVIEGNDFGESGIMGLKDGGTVPSVLIDMSQDWFGTWISNSEGNLVKEQGNFVNGTGGAKFQVVDFPTMYCSEMNPSDPLCDGYSPNRVVGHPANVIAQQQDASPGIGQALKSLNLNLGQGGNVIPEFTAPSQATLDQYVE